MGYDLKGKPMSKADHDHGRSNPHPVHGAAFGGKKADPFKKGAAKQDKAGAEKPGYENKNS